MKKSFLWAVVAIALTFFAVPSAGQDPKEPNPSLPSISSFPNSLTKALRKFQGDQRFQELRDKRIELLEAIPKQRASVQAKQAELAEMDVKIGELEAKIKSSKSTLESDELTLYRDRLRGFEAEKKRELLRGERLAERHEKLLASLASQNETIAALNTNLTQVKDKKEGASVTFDEARAALRRLTAPIDSKRSELQGIVDILEKELAERGGDDLFEKLASKRRELLSFGNGYSKPEIVEAENAIRAADRLLSTLVDTDTMLTTALATERKRTDELAIELREFEDREERNTGSLFGINADIVRMTTAIERQIEIDAQRVGNPVDLQAQLDLEAKDRDDLKIKLQEESTKLQKDILSQTTVENGINDLFIPRSAENTFKLWMSFAFALLVGLVIWKFFQITREDEKVRRAVFTAEAGIQFVTLFSLVIAIILFGITGILEGKELSALLGGISGYILGRSTPAAASKENVPPVSPTAAVVPPP